MTASLETHAAELTATFAVDYAIALLNGDLTTVSFTVDIGTDATHLVCAAAHKLVTNSRIRLSFSAGGALPACATPLLTNVDYYAIVVNSTTIQIKTAPANAALTFLSNGTGTLTLTEQELQPSDPIAVLINHEVRHPDERRFLYQAGTATPSVPNNDARFVEQSKNFAVNAANSAYTFKRLLLIRDGSLVVADVSGNRPELYNFPSNITIAPGTSKDIKLNVAQTNG